MLIRFRINYTRIIPNKPDVDALSRAARWLCCVWKGIQYNWPFRGSLQDTLNVFLSLQLPPKENSYLNLTASVERKGKGGHRRQYLIFSIHHVRHKGVDYKRGASANTRRNGFFLHRKQRTTSCVNERFRFAMRNGEPFVKSCETKESRWYYLQHAVAVDGEWVDSNPA